MKLSVLLEGLDCDLRGADVEVTSIAYDSRRVEPGALFVAWSGKHCDGHDFVEAALDAGASAVVSDRWPALKRVPAVKVANPRFAMARIARKFFRCPDEALTLIGVTGTNGKTTIAHTVASMLRSCGRRTASVGTLGVQREQSYELTGLTTPESVELTALLADLRDEGFEAVVLEVSSHALAQSRVDGLAFDVAVFTNLSRDHLDYHVTMDAYFQAKARLFRELLKPAGQAVINVDNGWGRSLGKELNNALTFSTHTDRRARVSAASHHSGPHGIDIEIDFAGDRFAARSTLLGEFNVTNLVASASVVRSLGYDVGSIASAMPEISAVPGRFERVNHDAAPLTIVDYAHTPDALERALGSLKVLTQGRLISVIGCGGERDPGKRETMGVVAAEESDVVFITNDNPRGEDPQAIVAEIKKGFQARSSSSCTVLLDRREAINTAIREAHINDAVLIAGKGHETFQIIGDRSIPFDDREVAREALARWEDH